jgi:hypothetical protein
MHKKSDYEQKKGDFKNLPDGIYAVVLDAVKLDLANKYGPRLNLTFKHKNRRLTWLDVRENLQSKKGPLAMAWFTLSKLGVGTEVSAALGDEYETETFLQTAQEELENKIGTYYEIELETTTAKNGRDYQNARVVEESDETTWEHFEMPKSSVGPSSSLDATEEIPF